MEDFVPKYIAYLGTAEGFQIDLRNPGIDQVALDYSVKHFGESTVGKVVDTWHRADITFDSLTDDFFKFDRKYAPKLKHDPTYLAVLESVRKEFVPAEKIIPLTTGAAAQHPMFPKDKSPGLPFKGKFKTKGEVISDPESMNYLRGKWYKIGDGKPARLADVALTYRAQICKKDKNKVRAVFGYPLEVFIEESRYVLPYTEWLKANFHRDFPIAYGIEMARGGMRYIHEMCSTAPEGSYFSMTDYSGFDKTVPPWLIRDAFSILMECFHLDRVDSNNGFIWEVDQTKTANRFRRMVNYFINTPVRLWDGRRYRKNGGIPSGSGFTNLVDTIINAIVTRYLVYHTTGSLPYADIYMGDDAFIVSESPLSLVDLRALALELFSMEISDQKSWITQRHDLVQFIGYYNSDGAAFKPQDTIIASFIFPERKPESPEVTCARALGQLWSCMNGTAGRVWLELVENLLEDFSIDPNWIDDYINDHPNRFRFLKSIGIDPRNIGIPKLDPSGRVGAIEPSEVPLRHFRSRRRNVAWLFSEYIGHPIEFILDEDVVEG